MFVAKYNVHPKGEGRYVRSFNTQMMGSWWKNHTTEKDRTRYVAWQMTHEQYHLSTDNLNYADFVYEEDKELYSKYLDVTFLKAELGVEPIAPATEVKTGEWCSSVVRLVE
jgi:hypothetical protein